MLLEPEHRKTIRGYVAELDGRILGIMGVQHGNPPVAFSQMTDEMRSYPKTIVQAIRLFKRMLEDNYEFVIAAASLVEPNTYRVLERAGFLPHTIEGTQHRGTFTWTR